MTVWKKAKLFGARHEDACGLSTLDPVLISVRRASEENSIRMRWGLLSIFLWI